MSDRKIVFVAYSSRDEEVARAVLEGVKRASALVADTFYHPWPYNDIPGTSLVSPILEKIDESAFIVADITYLNLNVVYEVGFAIGRGKRVFLVRHRGVAGDRALSQETGIFDTLGYYEYKDSEDLAQRLASSIETSSQVTTPPLDRRAPIYLVEPPVRTPAQTVLVSRVKKARYQFRSFIPSEDSRLSANDAIRQVRVSAGVVLLLLAQDAESAPVHNVRALFAAGLAHGMEKPTLILAVNGDSVPLDVRDHTKRFRNPEEIGDRVAAFVPEVNEYLQESDTVSIESGGLLTSLSLGEPTAENEMTTLSHYYLRTDQYQKALRGEANLVVGRKGAGKTALFIQVRDKIRSDRRNIVVDLKPESYQLIKLKEDILGFVTEGTRQHLITAFWEYLVLLEVAYKLLEKDKHTFANNHLLREQYLELQSAYEVDDFFTEGDFSERLQSLSVRIADRYRDRFAGKVDTKLTTHEVADLLYTHDVRELKQRVSAYLSHKHSVWVLLDNLDKGWSTHGVDAIDVIVLRCLIDAGRKIERDMHASGHTFHCIVFVRNDVYDHLMKRSSDYGKEMRVVLDWTDADLLREMLRLRLVSALGEEHADLEFQQLWPRICNSHYKGEETSNFIIERSLMRPRNVLKLMSHALGYANNFHRARISEEDIEKGLEAYSRDILIEVGRELADVFPRATDLLYYFIESAAVLSHDSTMRLLKEAGVDDGEAERVLDFLLYYGVLGLASNERNLFIYDVGYDLKQLKVRVGRMGVAARFVVNPAFWAALSIRESGPPADIQPSLAFNGSPAAG